MFKPFAATLLAGALSVGVASSEPLAHPAPRPIAQSQDGVPLFRVTIVGRTTAAVNYRPRRGDTKIDFAGTALLPKAEGHATVSGEQGYMKISARFKHLEPATRFGREYLTYVLWAITPEGRAMNLGEIQVDDDDAKVEVTTQLQAFGLVVTAEPYFAVTQPSDVVVIENIIRPGTTGSVEAIDVKYDLLRRGSYLMNLDVSRLNTKPLEPGSPLDLAEARNAVELARLAGADQFAAETFNKAARLLADAEEAKTRRRGSNAVMMPARQAAQTAEDARLIALKKQEEGFQADQRARAAGREQQAVQIAQGESARRHQAERDAAAAGAALGAAERDAATADTARVAAEAARAQSAAREQDALARAQSEAAARRQAELDAQAAGSARAAAEQGVADANAARVTAERGAADADAARVTAEAARLQAESAQHAAEARTQQAQGMAMQSEAEKSALRERLRVQLNVVLDTRETARGLIVNLSDVLFDTGKSDLKAGAREKLARVSGILVSQQGLRLEIEGHTDSVGSEASNQLLSERRAESVRVYLVGQKILSTSIGAAGFGESQPVGDNETASGRQQNRRVELVVSGDVIGRR